eukprot:TRINITY_DN6263_c0_g1_i1.p1 TRINITY_DN6263_c0_g1~~TRINITY_DN6263_c0_g1_i1.p1  ORF type:complete len:242 (-),score=64.72 TRINITY_DN6263_c0_g1_i1:12-737(-)
MRREQERKQRKMKVDQNRFQKQRSSHSEANDSLYVWFGAEPLLVSLDLLNSKLNLDKSVARILDLGCGNGHFCELLRALGFKEITGIDFCTTAILLAESIRKTAMEKESRSLGDGTSLDGTVTFLNQDILATTLPSDHFDLIIDKGTLDSVAMVCHRFDEDEDPEANGDGDPSSIGDPMLVERYVEQVYRIMKPGGTYILISCNHSREELQDILAIGWTLKEDLSHLFEDLLYLIFQKNTE